MRHISLSTSGIADKIDDVSAGKTADHAVRIAPRARRRDALVHHAGQPTHIPVERLMQRVPVLFRYHRPARISYEYMMARDKTDRAVAAPTSWRSCCEAGRATSTSSRSTRWRKVRSRPRSRRPCAAFQQALEKRGVTATVRRKLGPDIDAACGQLRRREMEEQG